MPQFKFYEEIKKFEKIDSNDDRRKKAREIYDTFIMRELLSNSGGVKNAVSVLNMYLIKTIFRLILKGIRGACPAIITEERSATKFI